MASQDKVPLRLKKVTLHYSNVEDRIRMDAESVQGDIIIFWLTQRLCRQLVKSLVGYFNKADMAATGASTRSLASVQQFLQQTASSNRQRVVAVAAAAPNQAVLLDKVQLRTSTRMIQMSLPLAEGDEAVLVFSPEETRQWMGILYQQYRRAEWPLEIWPRWIASKVGEEPQDGGEGEKIH